MGAGFVSLCLVIGFCCDDTKDRRAHREGLRGSFVHRGPPHDTRHYSVLAFFSLFLFVPRSVLPVQPVRQTMRSPLRWIGFRWLGRAETRRPPLRDGIQTFFPIARRPTPATPLKNTRTRHSRHDHGCLPLRKRPRVVPSAADANASGPSRPLCSSPYLACSACRRVSKADSLCV